MYHSITIGNKNTFDDWHLFPSVRPFVAPPLPKTRYVDILGMSGSLDYTEAPNKVIKYADREGSWEFIMLNPGDVPEYSIADEGSYHYDWAARYSEIMSYIQGKQFDKIVLEDDPTYHYKGRIWVNEYRSDPGWGRIVINYKLEPYKYKTANGTQYDTGYGSVTFNRSTIEYANRQTVIFAPASGLQPTPLHLKATPINGSSPFVTWKFESSDLELDSTGAIFAADVNKDLIIKSCPISNINNGQCSIVFGPWSADSGSNDGPVKIEYWWEEASL